LRMIDSFHSRGLLIMRLRFFCALAVLYALSVNPTLASGLPAGAAQSESREFQPVARINPSFIRRVPSELSSGAIRIMQLSEDQEAAWNVLWSEFLSVHEGLRDSLGRGFVLGDSASTPRADGGVADELQAWYREVRRAQLRLHAEAQVAFDAMASLLAENQVAHLPRAMDFVQRGLAIGSTNMEFPGLRFDFERVLLHDFADALDLLEPPAQGAVRNVLLEYATAATPIARRLERSYIQTVMGDRLIAAGRPATIGGRTYRGADGMRRTSERIVALADELRRANHQAVMRLLDLGIPELSAPVARRWFAEISPPGIHFELTELQRVARLVEPLGEARLEAELHEVRTADRIHFMAMLEAYFECYLTARARKGLPYAICPDTCRQLRSLLLERLRRVGTLAEEARAIAANRSDPAAETITVELERIEAAIDSADAVTDPCELFGVSP